MRLLKPAITVYPQPKSITSVLKQIELAGRTSYKSEYKITKDSYKSFIDKLTANKHLSPLEFGTIYLKQIRIGNKTHGDDLLNKYANNPYSKCNTRLNEKNHRVYYITTNYRVLIENGWEQDLEFLCKPTGFHHIRTCVKFICDRGVMCELTRHRHFSFMVESSRYCNYTKDRFSNQCSFIIPNWFEPDFPECENVSIEYSGNTALLAWEINDMWDMFPLKDETAKQEIEWITDLMETENSYNELIKNGWQPQQARSILPNALKTEVFMCGFNDDWQHFFNLRCTPAAHPQMRQLAIPLQETFNELYNDNNNIIQP